MRHKGLIILFLSISYLYLFGCELQITNLSDISFLYALIDLFINTFCLCFIPFLLKKKNKGLLEYNKGKGICLWNSIIWFFVSVFLTILLGFTIGVGGIGAVMYYFINKWAFVEEKEVKREKEKKKTESIYFWGDDGIEEDDKTTEEVAIEQVPNKDEIKHNDDTENKNSGFIPYK